MILREARILFKRQSAGLLTETAGGGTRFVYDPGWNEPIACALPILRREHPWPTGLHPVFEHLGPEGWLREQQAARAHLAVADDFGLLLRYGADCIGAIGVEPVTPADPPAAPAAGAVAPRRTVSGVQKKLLAVRQTGGLFAPAPADGPAPFIAKFNSESDATLVRNEALSLAWTADMLGRAEVTAFETGRVQGVEGPALLVHRFDRTPTDAPLRLEDFAQILARPQGRDHRGKYDASYEEVAAVIERHSVRPVIDKERLFRRLVVYALVGNCDAHLKNFSLLERPEGLRLAPAYDVVNTLLYGERFDGDLALAIGGRKRLATAVERSDFERFGAEIGLNPKVVAQAFADLARATRKAAGRLVPPQGEPPDGFVHRYREIVESQCLRLLA